MANCLSLLNTFLDGPSPHTNCGKGFVATCLMGSNIIFNTHILTNDAQELTPYSKLTLQIWILKLMQTDTEKILSSRRLALESLGWMTDKLANSATPPLLDLSTFLLLMLNFFLYLFSAKSTTVVAWIRKHFVTLCRMEFQHVGDDAICRTKSTTSGRWRFG